MQRLLSLALLLGLPAATGLATPSGLNNIPTADTIPHRTVAVQAFDTFGAGSHDFWSGFKTGWDLDSIHLEWGLDGHLSPDPAGPLFFQTKVGFTPWENGTMAIGVAGVALTDTDRAGNPFTYAVISQDFGFARLHVGYGVQTDANTMLLGIDRKWRILDRNLNLNADLVQTGDGDGWLTSVGLKYDLVRNVVFETWANLPDEGNATYVLKLNFVFTY